MPEMDQRCLGGVPRRLILHDGQQVGCRFLEISQIVA